MTEVRKVRCIDKVAELQARVTKLEAALREIDALRYHKDWRNLPARQRMGTIAHNALYKDET